MGLWQTFWMGDAITRGVASLLLAMSVASWAVILWKTWMLRRALADLKLATASFWQASDIDVAQQRLGAFDSQQLLQPLLQAASSLGRLSANTLATAGDRGQQLTRVLRDALHGVLHRLSYGQVLLATVGSTDRLWACSARSGAFTTRSAASGRTARFASSKYLDRWVRH